MSYSAENYALYLEIQTLKAILKEIERRLSDLESELIVWGHDTTNTPIGVNVRETGAEGTNTVETPLAAPGKDVCGSSEKVEMNPFDKCECDRRDHCVYLHNEMIECREKKKYALACDEISQSSAEKAKMDAK